MKEIIAANLIRYRKSLGLSQEQLAATTGVTRQSINNYENAKTLPDSKTLSALARALGVKLDDLLRQSSESFASFSKALDRALNVFTDLIQLKAHFQVSYTMMLMRLDQMGKLKYGDAIQKIRGEYKRRTGQSLPKEIELEPVISAEDFPVNQRFTRIIWQALTNGKVSELKAAELLNLTIKELRQCRQQARVYAIDAIF